MIIVTGATGFIGSAMIWQLNNRGVRDIIAVDTVPPETRPGVLAKRQISRFLLKDDLWAFLETDEAKQNVEGVVHMGACSSTTEMDVEFLTENNFNYTRRLWNWCTQLAKPMIYASSGAVYGGGEHGFDDASPSKMFKPLNPYGDSKAQFDVFVEESLAAREHHPTNWYGLRFFNVFGPNEYLKRDMASVVFKAFNQIRESGRLKLFKSHRPDFKDGQQLRDFVYVKDIVRWMDELLTRAIEAKKTGKPGVAALNGIYNMGFGHARTWNDLAAATFKALEKPMTIDYIEIPEEMRPRYQYFTEAKMDRLMSLGLSRPDWSLERAVTDYVVNHLKKFEGGSTETPWL
jgi:ADP-L-glycero-D-manno-heptose 6-epimerase